MDAANLLPRAQPAPIQTAPVQTAPIQNAGPGSADEADDRRRAQARAAAEEYEALFLGQMMAPMFENLDGGLFGGGPGEAVYRSMMVEQYGKTLARSGGIGIADAVEREILKMQEIQE